MKKVNIGHIGVVRGDRITLTDAIKMAMAGDIKIIKPEPEEPIPVAANFEFGSTIEEMPNDVHRFVHSRRDAYLKEKKPNKRPPAKKKIRNGYFPGK